MQAAKNLMSAFSDLKSLSKLHTQLDLPTRDCLQPYLTHKDASQTDLVDEANIDEGNDGEMRDYEDSNEGQEDMPEGGQERLNTQGELQQVGKIETAKKAKFCRLILNFAC